MQKMLNVVSQVEWDLLAYFLLKMWWGRLVKVKIYHAAFTIHA